MEIETDPDLSIHTSCHNDFFVLRTRVLVNGSNTEIRSIRDGKYVRAVFYYSGNNTGIKLLLVVNTVSTVLHQHGVYHVETFYCEVQSLLFRTVFSTELCLKKFILAIGEIKSVLELQLQSLFTKETKSVQQLAVEVQSELLLVSPSQQKAKRPEINLVTAENYSNSLIRWKDSKQFDFGSLYLEEGMPTAMNLVMIRTLFTNLNKHSLKCEDYLGLPSYVKVILTTTLDIQDIWSCPWYSLGQPETSKVVPDMIWESIISPRSEKSHLS